MVGNLVACREHATSRKAHVLSRRDAWRLRRMHARIEGLVGCFGVMERQKQD
jgi:hypothetical protein